MTGQYGRIRAILYGVGWAVAVALGILLVLSLAGITLDPLHAAIQAVTPALVVPAALVLVLALIARRFVLAAVAGVVAVGLVLIVLPAVLATEAPPRWAAHAPRVSVVVANVKYDNPDTAAKARQLLHADADVMIVVELSTPFAAALDRLGAAHRYPSRVTAPHNSGAGGIGLYSKRPLTEKQMRRVGPLRVPTGVVRVGHTPLRLVGIHAHAPKTAGELTLWQHQLDALTRYTEHLHGATLVAGDFNATRWHPAFAQLLHHGLRDAHESAGDPFSMSWPVLGRGLLSFVRPVARLDHALVSGSVAVLKLRQLGALGSDHRAFVVTLAVEQ